jgi:hypothetical protein
MQVLVQLLHQNNQSDSGSDTEDNLPVIHISKVIPINNRLSIGSNISTPISQEIDIKKGNKEEVFRYESDSTTWSDKEENLWP